MSNKCSWIWDRKGRASSTVVLGARPSALGGAATVLDLMGIFKLYNYSESPWEADAAALRSDWLMTGQDMWVAMHTVSRGCLNRTMEGQESLFDPDEILSR